MNRRSWKWNGMYCIQSNFACTFLFPRELNKNKRHKAKTVLGLSVTIHSVQVSCTLSLPHSDWNWNIVSKQYTAIFLAIIHVERSRLTGLSSIPSICIYWVLSSNEINESMNWKNFKNLSKSNPQPLDLQMSNCSFLRCILQFGDCL